MNDGDGNTSTAATPRCTETWHRYIGGWAVAKVTGAVGVSLHGVELGDLLRGEDTDV